MMFNLGQQSYVATLVLLVLVTAAILYCWFCEAGKAPPTQYAPPVGQYQAALAGEVIRYGDPNPVQHEGVRQPQPAYPNPSPQEPSRAYMGPTPTPVTQTRKLSQSNWGLPLAYSQSSPDGANASASRNTIYESLPRLSP